MEERGWGSSRAVLVGSACGRGSVCGVRGRGFACACILLRLCLLPQLVRSLGQLVG